MSRYRAFLSYSHEDRPIALAVQRALHRLGRAWYQRPAFAVFRDDSSLGAGALWESLERALEDSDYFVLLASPEAARSDWVRREIGWWVAHKDPDDVLIALIRGEIAWDDARGDLAESTTALPPALSGTFSEEPRWVDMRETPPRDHTTLRDPAFQDRMADLAATLHGCDKSELVGEELRQQHRWTRIRNAAIALLAVLTLLALAAAGLFYLQLRESRAQTATAEAREFAARSQQAVNPYEALTLAVEAQSRTDNPLPEARLAYTRAVQRTTAQPVRPVSALLKADREQIDGSSMWSPDGARIATSSGHGWKVRDSRSGTPIASGAAEKDRQISSIAWSPDGRRIVTADDAAQLRIWDPASGLPVGPPLGGTPRKRGDPIEFGVGVSWSPRGDRLASIGPDSLLIWPIGPEGATAPPLSVRTRWLLTVEWSPDGSRVATVDFYGAIQIWDPTTGTQDGQPMPGKGSLLSASIAWSPDGTRLASTSPRGVEIWALAHRALPALTFEGEWTEDVAWSPDGTRLVVVGHNLQIRDAATGSRIGDLVYDHEAQTYLTVSRIRSVAWSPDGSRIVTDALDGSTRFWAPNPVLTSRPFVHASSWVRNITWPSDSTKMIIDVGESVAIWSVGSTSPLRPVHSADADTVLGVSPDGQMIAVSGESTSVRIIDSTTGALHASLDGQPDIRTVIWAPRGPWLAAVDISGGIWLWDVDQGVPVGPPLTTPVRGKWSSVAWSPDGTQLVTAETDGPLRLWNFSEAMPGTVLDEHAGEASLAWSPDGMRIATIGEKKAVWLYDVKSSTRTRAQLASAGLLGKLTWHPSSSYLAVSGGQTMTFLDARSGGLIGSFTASDKTITAFAFSPDGTRLATADDDNAIRLWDTLAEEQVCAIAREALSPDLLTNLLGNGRPAPRCATRDALPRRPPIPVLAARI